MSAIRRSLFALVLLGMAVASATPAAAQEPRGIWVKVGANSVWTLTIVNLTDYNLELVTNSVTTTANNQRSPFYGVATCDEKTLSLCFPLGPFQNVTWKSNWRNGLYLTPSWNGTLTLLPEKMDPEWTATLNFEPYKKGTFVYLTADFAGNPNWVDNTGNNISCSYPGWYNSVYNVMTLSGTDLVASLYAPYVADQLESPTNPPPMSVDVTLVIRQRWPHTAIANGYDDSILMPCLRYQDNQGNW